MNWQELLARVLVSAAAGVVSTGVWVASAENAPSWARRKKKKRRRRGRAAEDVARRRRRRGSRGSKSKDGARKTRQGQADAKAKSAKSSRDVRTKPLGGDPGNSAMRHLASTAEPGMSTDEFLANLKVSSQRMKLTVGRWMGVSAPAPVDDVVDEPSAESRRAKRRPKAPPKDGLEALKEEAFFFVKDKAKKKIVEASGVGAHVEKVGETLGAIRDGAGDLGERAAGVGRKLSDGARQNLGSLGEVAGSVGKGGQKLADKVIESIPEGAEEVGDGLKGIGRWLQGPGAQDYDGARRGSGARRQENLLETDAPPAARLLRVEARSPEPDPAPEQGSAAPPPRPTPDAPQAAPAPAPGPGEVVDAELKTQAPDEVVEAKVNDDVPPPVRRHRSN